MIRRLASWILNTAMRRAVLRTQQPERSREWGLAMERELDYVQGDWAALRWALGSATALFRPAYAPMRSLTEVGCRRKALAAVTQRRTRIGYGACLLVMAGFTPEFFLPQTLLQRLASAAIIFAALYMICQLHGARARQISLPPEFDVAEGLSSFRLELTRQRDFHSGIAFWSRLFLLSLGFLTYILASALAEQQQSRILGITSACFVVLCAVAVRSNLSLAQRYEQRISELDQLAGSEA